MKQIAEKIRIERPDPVVAEILRTKTPRQRLEMAFASNRLVRERLSSHLRIDNPDWSCKEVAAEVARRMLWNKPMS